MQHLPGSPPAPAGDPPRSATSSWDPRDAPQSPMKGQSLGWLLDPKGTGDCAAKLVGGTLQPFPSAAGPCLPIFSLMNFPNYFFLHKQHPRTLFLPILLERHEGHVDTDTRAVWRAARGALAAGTISVLDHPWPSHIRGCFWGWTRGFQPWHLLRGRVYNPRARSGEPGPPSRLSCSIWKNPSGRLGAITGEDDALGLTSLGGDQSQLPEGLQWGCPLQPVPTPVASVALAGQGSPGLG